MTKEEKFEKITKQFSLLPGEKQDHILGVLQALAFANETTNGETVPLDSKRDSESV